MKEQKRQNIKKNSEHPVFNATALIYRVFFNRVKSQKHEVIYEKTIYNSSIVYMIAALLYNLVLSAYCFFDRKTDNIFGNRNIIKRDH
jgi:hypothetical protein